jgi:hypothetical protein
MKQKSTKRGKKLRDLRSQKDIKGGNKTKTSAKKGGSKQGHLIMPMENALVSG